MVGLIVIPSLVAIKVNVIFRYIMRRDTPWKIYDIEQVSLKPERFIMQAKRLEKCNYSALIQTLA